MRGMLNRWRPSFVKVKGVFFNLAKISIPTLCFVSWAAQQDDNCEGKKEKRGSEKQNLRKLETITPKMCFLTFILL